jgi:hypothetical protein
MNTPARRTSIPWLVVAMVLVASCTGAPATSGSAADRAAITGVVDRFFAFYNDCMTNPPSQAAGQVSSYCQDNSDLTTPTFAANLVAGGAANAGADPVTCSQQPPESFVVDPNVQVDGDTATAQVVESFGAMQVTVQVELELDEGAWLVDNIVCPTP